VPKVDLIVAAPIHFDFPGFRAQLRRYRSYFEKVIIAWSQHYIEGDCIQWVEDEMRQDKVRFIPWQQVDRFPSSDWGQRVIGTALDHSTSPLFLITQQDFIIHNEIIFDLVLSQKSKLVSRIGGNDSTRKDLARFEPDFLYVNRELWNQTSRDISVSPAGDHYASISLELKALCPNYLTLEDLGLCSPRDWEHFGGFFHNYRLIRDGVFEGIHKRERFAQYNRDILSLPMDPSFYKIVEKASRL
jgi:hypothetical protein